MAYHRVKYTKRVQGIPGITEDEPGMTSRQLVLDANENKLFRKVINDLYVKGERNGKLNKAAADLLSEKVTMLTFKDKPSKVDPNDVWLVAMDMTLYQLKPKGWDHYMTRVSSSTTAL